MIRPTNMYLNYKITNKLIGKVIDKEYNGKWKLRLNPNRYFLNRTNFDYWLKNIEKIELQCNSSFTLDELRILEKDIIDYLNMILITIDVENNQYLSNIDIIVN